ncbi:hypothetical protein ACFXPY_36810 [Streptomyces sp. NPDC059153]|uniref:hypothetical protein n=1 Tax=Streptomyces sp. NPDC059153 TaxID=3346743 RepID=UPI00368AA001
MASRPTGRTSDGSSRRVGDDTLRKAFVSMAAEHLPGYASRLTPQVLRHFAASDLYLNLPHVAGFPGLGVLRRLRPVPDRSAVDAPSPGSLLETSGGARFGTVPVFTVVRSMKEEPDLTWRIWAGSGAYSGHPFGWSDNS